MATHEEWTADAVLAALLTPWEMAALILIAQVETRNDMHGQFAKTFERHPDWGSVEFQYDRRDRKRLLQIGGLRLADGVTYSSARDQLYGGSGMGSDATTPTRVFFEAVIRVGDLTPPETILDALVGRHATAIIDHRALCHPDLTITWAGLDGRPGKWEGFSTLLETVTVVVPSHHADAGGNR